MEIDDCQIAMIMAENIAFNHYKQHMGHTLKLIERDPTQIVLFCETCEREGRESTIGDYDVDVLSYQEIT